MAGVCTQGSAQPVALTRGPVKKSARLSMADSALRQVFGLRGTAKIDPSTATASRSFEQCLR